MDGAYPLYGSVKLDNDMPLSAALAPRNGAFGAVVDPTLLARLGIKPGARLTIGSAPIEIAAVLVNEPDKLAGGIAFGPRVIISEAALNATGLIQPGSLVRRLYRSPCRAAATAPRTRWSPTPRSNCPTPAGRCAAATTPRPRWSATSSASPSSSRWSG